MTTVLILAAICVVGAFIGGFLVGAYVVDKQRLDDEDEDCYDDDEDEETGSPYRRNCIPADPERQFDKDGGRPKPAPLKKPLSDELNALEVVALTAAVNRLKKTALRHAKGGFMALYEDDMQRLREYKKRLGKLT